jgi:hypothetical protein
MLYDRRPPETGPNRGVGEDFSLVPIPAVSLRNKVRAQDFRMRPCEAS